MKISVDDKELYTLTATQKQVLKNDINADELDADLCRRLQWVLNHKYERCMERLKKEWEPKLSQRVESIPTDKDALAQLIFSQPDYKDRKARDAEDAALGG